jgi:hypothetical protein
MSNRGTMLVARFGQPSSRSISSPGWAVGIAATQREQSAGEVFKEVQKALKLLQTLQ